MEHTIRLELYIERKMPDVPDGFRKETAVFSTITIADAYWITEYIKEIQKEAQIKRSLIVSTRLSCGMFLGKWKSQHIVSLFKTE